MRNNTCECQNGCVSSSRVLYLPSLNPALDMRDPKGENSTEYVCDACSAVPETMAQRVLRGSVEHRSDQCESGIDGGFEGSKEYSQSRQATEIMPCSHAHQNAGPNQSVRRVNGPFKYNREGFHTLRQ